MSDIDLIPGIYKTRQKLSRQLRLLSMTFGFVIAVILLAVVLLHKKNQTLQEELSKLQYAKAITSQQRANLLDLNQRKQEMVQQLDLLDGLRSGAAAVGMLRTVDRAMSDSSLWFTDWTFRRAGTMEKVSSDQDPRANNYFVIVSRTQPALNSKAWAIKTQMKIDGEAVDHAALSNFVSSLVDQPEIQSVHVLRTETFILEQRPLIRYSLDVVVAWPQQASEA